MAYPLVEIIVKDCSSNTETLACGHTIPRPLGLGEFAMEPSKAKKRRCFKCGENPHAKF